MIDIDDVDVINILCDPLQSVLAHQMEGKKVHFSGNGIVPMMDEKRPTDNYRNNGQKERQSHIQSKGSKHPRP